MQNVKSGSTICDVRRWNVILGILALVLCGVLALVFWPKKEKPEPVYKGRKLSEWVSRFGADPLWPENREALVAIGTNAIPCYQKWITYEPSFFQDKYFQLISAFAWLRLKRPGGEDRSVRAMRAALALGNLGQHAEPAIPQLAFCATRFPRSEILKYKTTVAIMVLGDMGDIAVPAYLSLITNGDARVRARAITHVSAYNIDTSIVERVQASLRDPDPLVRAAGSNTLFRIQKWQDGN